jgi:hypothetical protein
MFLEFDVTDSIKKDFEKRIVDYATQSGMPLTEESIRGLFGMVADAIRRENESLINAAIAEKARTQAIEEYKKEIHNPSALSSERKAAEKKVDGQQELLNALAPK